jgi:FkbM family methyltransferase
MSFGEVGKMKSFNYLGKEIIFDYLEGDHISRDWVLRNSFYEIKLLEWIKDKRLKGTYVDVGSHHGNHIVYYSLFCDAEKVIAIEGSPYNFQFLETNVGLNKLDNVVLHNTIASNKNETLELHFNFGNTGDTTFQNSDEYDQTVSNESKLLDDLLKGEENISLMKLDIQNMEWFALDGCRKILKQHTPLIIIEWNSPSKNPHLDKIERLLEEMNYKLLEVMNVPSKIHIYQNMGM